jgi:hypothetical protein
MSEMPTLIKGVIIYTYGFWLCDKAGGGMDC